MWFAIQDINQQINEGAFGLLAKTITNIENNVEGKSNFLTHAPKLKVPIVGITGPPGAGKSTLITALIKQYVTAGKKVAVLSVDPSSPFHTGALLGDRIRMKEWYLHPQVYIRSLSSRGHLGGVNASMKDLIALMQCCAFDMVFIETVGVGQSEVEIARLTPLTMVVLVPEAGDEIQMMKSGLIEVADIFVVNKSDRPSAADFTRQLQNSIMEKSHKNNPMVLQTIATTDTGVEELANLLLSRFSTSDRLHNP